MGNQSGQSSIKSLFQSMQTDSASIVKGIVTTASPLAIQVLNNEKMVVTGDILICATYLTEHQTTATINLDAGTIDAVTQTTGSHTHDEGTHSGHDGGGTGSHTHGGGTHNHYMQTFNIYNATITIHNGLEVGELVWLLRFENGKHYYAFDKVVE